MHRALKTWRYLRNGLCKGLAYFEPLHIQWLPCRREYIDTMQVSGSHGGLVQFGTGRTLITFVFKRDV